MTPISRSPQIFELTMVEAARWSAKVPILLKLHSMEGKHQWLSSQILWQLFLHCVNVWTTGTSVVFRVVEESQRADVRVSIIITDDTNGDKTSWSALGTYARNFSEEKATMLLKFSCNTSLTRIRRAMYHEIGHSMAFGHEHAHPQRPWDWSRNGFQRKFGVDPHHDSDPENIADPERVKRIESIKTNYLFQYPSEDVAVTGQIDLSSVMMYCTGGLTDNSALEVWSPNFQPSDQDLEGAKTFYPPDPVAQSDLVEQEDLVLVMSQDESSSGEDA